MSYRCLTRQIYQKGVYEITPIRQEDIRPIKEWRNAQIEILRQAAPLTDAEQERYWSQVLVPSFDEKHPKQILFSFLKEGECIGYGGLTHIDWEVGRAEVSFLLDPSRTQQPEHYQREFVLFLELLKECAFKTLRFHRLFAETFHVRPVHVRTLEFSGFRLEGILKDHVKVNGKHCDSLIHGLLNEEL